MSFFQYYFFPIHLPWYIGAIWGNLLAWLICGFFAFIWARRKIIKWDKKRKVEDTRKHEEMKQHITNEHLRSRQHLAQQLKGKRG